MPDNKPHRKASLSDVARWDELDIEVALRWCLAFLMAEDSFREIDLGLLTTTEKRILLYVLNQPAGIVAWSEAAGAQTIPAVLPGDPETFHEC